MTRGCQLAQLLKRRINVHPNLQLLAPVTLNIVCFRYVPSTGNVASTILDEVRLSRYLGYDLFYRYRMCCGSECG